MIWSGEPMNVSRWDHGSYADDIKLIIICKILLSYAINVSEKLKCTNGIRNLHVVYQYWRHNVKDKNDKYIRM